MEARPTYRMPFVALVFAMMASFMLNIGLGSVSIPLTDLLTGIFGGGSDNASWNYIIWNYRIPKALTAIGVGSALSLSGLLMQTLFRNPLAGPFVLGISSGASLGAALLIMGAMAIGIGWGTSTGSEISLAAAASLGSLLVLMAVMVVASRVRDTMSLLIIGLMFGSLTAAIVSVLSYFTSAEQLQRFIYWSFGSVGNLSWPQLTILGAILIVGTILALACIKALNALLLGEQYALSLGVHLKRSRYLIIVATGLLAGGATAFAGPIAFVGLAVPHLTRQLIDTMEHRVLVPAVMLYGAILLLLCDTLAQLPSMAEVLPINAITSLFGAPVVIWLLIRKRRMLF